MRGINCKAPWIKELCKCSPFTVIQGAVSFLRVTLTCLCCHCSLSPTTAPLTTAPPTPLQSSPHAIAALTAHKSAAVQKTCNQQRRSFPLQQLPSDILFPRSLDSRPWSLRSPSLMVKVPAIDLVYEKEDSEFVCKGPQFNPLVDLTEYC